MSQELKELGTTVAQEDELLTLAHFKDLGLQGDREGGQRTLRDNDSWALWTGGGGGSLHGCIKSSDKGTEGRERERDTTTFTGEEGG
jgi:hypothetical protein